MGSPSDPDLDAALARQLAISSHPLRRRTLFFSSDDLGSIFFG
jgi:hypothetical protein